jgi:hypothetical protein
MIVTHEPNRRQSPPSAAAAVQSVAPRTEPAQHPLGHLEWQVASQSLRFTASDILLGEYGFQALVSETTITELTEFSEPPLPPPEAASRGLAGAVIRSFPVSSRLDAFVFTGPWLRYTPVQYKRFLVDASGSLEEYLTRFSSKSRKNIRRSAKKYESLSPGGECWRVYRTVSEVREFLRLASAISVNTYQTRLFNEGLSDTDEIRLRLEETASQGRLRGYMLFHGDAPSAFALCEAKGNVLLYKTIGYDPNHASLSPGTVLLWHLLTQLFTDKEFRYLDFGEGEAFYKEFFSNCPLPCARVYYFRRTPMLVAAVCAHCAWHRTLDAVVRLPGVRSLVNNMRRVIRKRASGGASESAETQAVQSGETRTLRDHED